MSRRASAITAAGIVLSQPTSTTSAVEQVAAGDQLDRVGDDLAADQRGLHALAAHRDAVGDRDGVELERRAAGLADAVLHVHGELAQVIVAGTNLDPGVGDADERLPQILVGQAGGAQHRPRRRPAGAVGQRGTAPFQRMSGHFIPWIGRLLTLTVPVSPVGPARAARTAAPGVKPLQKGRPLSDDGLAFIARLGSSSAHRPAYNAERKTRMTTTGWFSRADTQRVSPTRQE